VEAEDSDEEGGEGDATITNRRGWSERR
jgi:hypothetical protein